MQLINWKPQEKQFVSSGIPQAITKLQFQKLLASKKRPQEIEDLVDALTAMWGRLRVHCGECFAGNLYEYRKGRGCCGSCPSLGETACVAKPVGCALYTCGVEQFAGRYKEGQKIPPIIDALLGKVRLIMQFARQNGLHNYYFTDGYLKECDRVWTPDELQAARYLTKLVKSVEYSYY